MKAETLQLALLIESIRTIRMIRLEALVSTYAYFCEM